ncbi:MAG: hypothetical protein FWF02_02345 [Micrococcales bacterium]|nr:hypothetical protein [Micrococcales bacterium]MCL2666531.1 hypothetical protein [Micrococcales bacterium]
MTIVRADRGDAAPRWRGAWAARKAYRETLGAAQAQGATTVTLRMPSGRHSARAVRVATATIRDAETDLEVRLVVDDREVFDSRRMRRLAQVLHAPRILAAGPPMGDAAQPPGALDHDGLAYDELVPDEQASGQPPDGGYAPPAPRAQPSAWQAWEDPSAPLPATAEPEPGADRSRPALVDGERYKLRRPAPSAPAGPALPRPSSRSPSGATTPQRSPAPGPAQAPLQARGAPAAHLATALENLDEPFATTLLRLIDTKQLSDVQVYRRANLDRRLFSKMRSNPGYMPSKRTALALAVGMGLDLDETHALLARAGYTLSSALTADVIVEYFISRGTYDVLAINEALFYFDQPLLGA